MAKTVCNEPIISITDGGVMSCILWWNPEWLPIDIGYHKEIESVRCQGFYVAQITNLHKWDIGGTRSLLHLISLLGNKCASLGVDMLIAAVDSGDAEGLESLQFKSFGWPIRPWVLAEGNEVDVVFRKAQKGEYDDG